MSLINVGTVAFDTIETPFGKTDKIIGGASTYTSICTSYFTDKTKIISVVGDDFPASYLEFFKSKNIDIEGIQIKNGEKTFFWSGRYHDNMNQRDTLDTQLNVLENFNPIIPESYQDCDYLMLGNLTPQVQYDVIKKLNKRPKLIVLDTMNFWMDVAMDDLKKVLKEIDVLSINDEEARQLSREYSLKKASKKIMEMGSNTLIIKKGEHGALLFQGKKMFYVPALPLEEVCDPTGAGDTFAGGFIGHLASTDDVSWDNMKKAIVVGSAMASFTVEQFGTKALENLTQNQIQERIKAFYDLTNFTI